MYRVNCPPGTITHIVKPNDTLYKIAIMHNTTVKNLMLLNPGIAPYNLIVGQSICVPHKTPPCVHGIPYIVKAGDTFYTIATIYNVSYNDLKIANPGVDFDRLVAGQRLCIPAHKPVNVCSTNKYYIIKAGDTLSKIAETLTLSATDILRYNPSLAPKDFVEGLRICLPPEAQV